MVYTRAMWGRKVVQVMVVGGEGVAKRERGGCKSTLNHPHTFTHLRISQAMALNRRLFIAQWLASPSRMGPTSYTR